MAVVLLQTRCVFLGGNKQMNKQNFYDRDLYEYDVDRLPLYYPYELISTLGPEGLMVSDGSKLAEKCHFSGVINSVSVSDKVITMHGDIAMKGSGIYCVHTQDTVYFPQQWSQFVAICKQLKVSTKLFSVVKVHATWMKDGTLPWPRH